MVAGQVGMPPRTAYRYFQDWKKQPRNLEMWYRMLRAVRHSGRVTPEEFARSLADVVGMTPEQVSKELEKPWGLKRLLSGKVRELERGER